MQIRPCVVRCSQPFRSRRQHSTSPLISPQREEVNIKVKVGLSGHIFLNIYHPPTPPSSSRPVIIYLPPGPQPHRETFPLSSLASSSNSIVVRLNYRLSVRHPFPTPIHDVLAGYDWIRKHVFGERFSNTFRDLEKPKLGVCGEFVGGSLASMLALTECFPRKQGISAAGIGNPVADWTSLDFEGKDTNASSLPRCKSTMETLRASTTRWASDEPLTTKSLLLLRDRIFVKNDRYFDPFASPLLFFCGPSFDLPAESHHEASDPTAEQPRDDTVALVKKRLSHRVYPPRYSELRLPKMRVELGNESILMDQGLKFVELMRRSVRLWEYGKLDIHNDGSDRIALVERTKAGWWKEGEIVELGTWFAEAFR